ncbi:hypothetical protein GCM10010383_35460 [Streptomyces lomondensis]|uniref:Nitroreductase n=2 Tax=Streptomyces lomondensis TaxID=68229 RepID=A0ABQ2X6U4_9ACTN|nr:hypothetical protein GCM10010383_35460 [Streptomyces lomondensis]
MATVLTLPAMRRELAELLHWSGEAAQTGMAVEALFPDADHQDMPARQWFLTHADPERTAERLRHVYAVSPGLLAVVATRADDPRAWCDAGRAAYRLLLRAAADGLTHDINAGPVEIPTLTPQLAAELEPGWRPQVLLRIGRPSSPSHTTPSVRRTIQLR